MQFSVTQKNILEILADGEFHSGNTIAKKLNISRSAVCKQVHLLAELGITNSAISGKGYRLNHAVALLDADSILNLLSKPVLDLLSDLQIHDYIASTNTYLSELVHQGQSTGTVCFAECQTAGRGRRGRQWVSPFGSNIAVSILWRFQQGPAAIAGLSLVIGIAVVRALQALEIDGIGLKWPNDIFWQGKKLGGILVEVSGESEGPCSAVIGIGLNGFIDARQAQEITQEWTDLTAICRHNFLHKNQLAAVLINTLLPMLKDFEATGVIAYLPEWRSYDCMLERPVSLKMGDQTIAGIVKGIDDQGLLILQQRDGSKRAFASGEVSLRLADSKIRT